MVDKIRLGMCDDRELVRKLGGQSVVFWTLLLWGTECKVCIPYNLMDEVLLGYVFCCLGNLFLAR